MPPVAALRCSLPSSSPSHHAFMRRPQVPKGKRGLQTVDVLSVLEENELMTKQLAAVEEEKMQAMAAFQENMRQLMAEREGKGGAPVVTIRGDSFWAEDATATQGSNQLPGEAETALKARVAELEGERPALIETQRALEGRLQVLESAKAEADSKHAQAEQQASPGQMWRACVMPLESIRSCVARWADVERHERASHGAAQARRGRACKYRAQGEAAAAGPTDRCARGGHAHAARGGRCGPHLRCTAQACVGAQPAA